MAVAQKPDVPQVADVPPVAIEEAAFDLLQCFYDGVDEFVLQKAVEIAIEESSYEEDGVTVLMRESHVDRAGKEVCRVLETLLKKGLPESVRAKLVGMKGCFESNLK